MGDLKTTFADAVCPTPSGSDGFSGTPGGLDLGSGPNGLVSQPWASPFVPTPDGSSPNCADLGGPPIKQTPSGDSTYEGTTQMGDITAPPSNTIDKR